MFAYLATITATAVIAFGLGRWLAVRRPAKAEKLSPVAAAMLFALGILWLLAARFARNYADMDGLGTDYAGSFAQSGKWFILLAAIFFGHGWILGAHQIPDGAVRRVFYYIAVLGLTTLIVSLTIPIYFLLDAGQRDKNGLLRQSQKVEVTCGAVALLNYLERYRQHAPLTEREVSRICHITPEGTTPSALVNAAHYYGLTNANARVLTLTELDRATLPAIVSISTLPTVHHATLLIKLDTDRAWFIDPAYGFWDVPRQRFQEIWYGKTILLE
jgi:hypothetical protein